MSRTSINILNAVQTVAQLDIFPRMFELGAKVYLGEWPNFYLNFIEDIDLIWP